MLWWNFLLQPLMTGLIIDSFDQLRHLANASKQDMEKRCIISDIERFRFDGFPGEWEQRRGGKYVWNYFQFIEWLQRQSPTDLSAPQMTVFACLKEDRTDFLPLGVFVAKQRQELQEPKKDEDVLNVLKSFMAESRGEWHRLEQEKAARAVHEQKFLLLMQRVTVALGMLPQPGGEDHDEE
mmetsp:Transcript_5130/g.11360  ORF Transcript_5130/g.11360 Transcript_5130/m.11360 type:complete len:181 (+) Transcript_5130:2-544(+)